MRSVLLFPLLLLSCVVTAQYRVGVKAGVNLADVVMTNYIDPDAESDLQSKLGMHAGIFASSRMDKWKVVAEVLYSNKGVNANSIVNLHYVGAVCMAQYYVRPKLLVELGGEIDYLLAAKSEGEDVRNTWNNKLDLGIDVGMQYEFSEAFAAGARYFAGFSSVIDTQDGSGSQTEPIKYQNRVLQISLYYSVIR